MDDKFIAELELVNYACQLNKKQSILYTRKYIQYNVKLALV